MVEVLKVLNKIWAVDTVKIDSQQKQVYWYTFFDFTWNLPMAENIFPMPFVAERIRISGMMVHTVDYFSLFDEHHRKLKALCVQTASLLSLENWRQFVWAQLSYFCLFCQRTGSFRIKLAKCNHGHRILILN